MDADKVIELWEKQEFNELLKQHSIRVAAMALVIADKFIEEGKEVDKELVKWGALLHDIGKMHNISGKDNSAHNNIGEAILIKEGYPKIAKISHEHFIDFIVDLGFTSNECEIVAIADCLVNPDGFVTFEERKEYNKINNPNCVADYTRGAKILGDYFKRLFGTEDNFRKIAKELTEKLDFENKSYKELIQELDLPSEKEIDSLLEEFRVPERLNNHMHKVKDIALFIASKLNKKGEDYNLRILDVAGRLHDLTKPLNFNNPKEENYEFWDEKKKELGDGHHGEVAAGVLHKYPKLCEVISNHNTPKIMKDNLSKEAVLLNYSDRRVNDDKIVSISERFDYLDKTYGLIDNRKALETRYKKIEKELFLKLGFAPEDLKAKMKEELQDE